MYVIFLCILQYSDRGRSTQYRHKRFVFSGASLLLRKIFPSYLHLEAIKIARPIEGRWKTGNREGEERADRYRTMRNAGQRIIKEGEVVKRIKRVSR